METLTKIQLIDIIKENMQKKANLEFLLESLNGVSWEFDLKANKFTYVSKNSESILGYKVEM